MEEEKTLLSEVASDTYDAADRPFDFLETGGETALICEPDPSTREKISNILKSLGYRITEPTSARDALKRMRFHVYDLVVLNENFDTGDADNNDVLNYLSSLSMSIRRQIFVALVSDRFRTMDNMAAFNRSVNIVINPESIDDIGPIIQRGTTDNTAFYHVFREILRKKGRI
ncbi:MAG: response regulator [Syntrophales bacterium]|nr:response regulator [Syntrophales bacterium]